MGAKGTSLMAIATRQSLALETLLKLGRVSNLPTVWTNVLTGTVLGGGSPWSGRTSIVALAMSLFYVGGMFLNDYCDRNVDARERPRRPIPAGEISERMVAAIACALLVAGMALIAMFGIAAAAGGLALGLAIVGYDFFHKGNPVAPIVMGLCRALVYCAAAAAAVGSVSAIVGVAAATILAFTAGLTYAAQQENLDRIGNLWPLLLLAAPMIVSLPALMQGTLGLLVYLGLVVSVGYAVYLLARLPVPGSVPRAVGLLIAGISLVDAALLASGDAIAAALIAGAGFTATLLLQKYIPGT
jgi:4-hydroxybenzoate polyprenyltransferase